MFLELRFRSNMARFESSIDDTLEISLLILYDQFTRVSEVGVKEETEGHRHSTLLGKQTE